MSMNNFTIFRTVFIAASIFDFILSIERNTYLEKVIFFQTKKMYRIPGFLVSFTGAKKFKKLQMQQGTFSKCVA